MLSIANCPPHWHLPDKSVNPYLC